MKITKLFKIEDANILNNSITEDEYPHYDSLIEYPFGQHVIVSAENLHQVYKSAHGNNKGNNPLGDDVDNPLHWSLVGATNAYKMFDHYQTSQTVVDGLITFEVEALGAVNVISFREIDAASVQLIAYDSNGSEFYNSTKHLTSYATLNGYFDYYFTPFFRKNTATFDDIPPISDARFFVCIKAGGSVKLGAFVGGYAYDLGAVINQDTSVKHKDFSIKEQKPTGEYYFAKGAFSVVTDFHFSIFNNKFDLFQRLIRDLRAEPTLIIGHDQYEATDLLGLIVDAPTRLEYEKKSTVRMQVQSLI